MNLPGLASIEVATTFTKAVERWRALPWVRVSEARPSNGRSRPAWTKPANPGHKTTYLHLFAKQVSSDMLAKGERSNSAGLDNKADSCRECRGQPAICTPA